MGSSTSLGVATNQQSAIETLPFVSTMANTDCHHALGGFVLHSMSSFGVSGEPSSATMARWHDGIAVSRQLGTRPLTDALALPSIDLL